METADHKETKSSREHKAKNLENQSHFHTQSYRKHSVTVKQFFGKNS